MASTRSKRKAATSTKASLEEVLARIHAANPTGLDLPAKERRSRYEQKAALQSALVEDYPDLVSAMRHDDMPGVVSLAVPSLHRSAGHAVLEALSSRAQARLQEYFAATAPDPSKSSVASAELLERPPGAQSALLRARAFLRAYDFECAEETLARALESPTERDDAFHALVELYVETLGRFVDALEMAKAHPSCVAPASAGHLALAAGKAGRIDDGVAFLKRALDEDLTPALDILVDEAVAQRNWTQLLALWRFIGRGLILNASNAAYVTLADRVRGVVTMTTEADFDADGGLAELVAVAAPQHEAFRRWQDHRVLRAAVPQWLRQLETLDTGATALEQTLRNLEGARAWLDTGALSKLEQAWQRLEEARNDRIVAELVARVASETSQSVCRAYLRLSTTIRNRVKAESGAQLLIWLDAVERVAGSESATVEATLAWCIAATQTDDDARLTLTPHVKVLSQIADFKDRLAPIFNPSPSTEGATQIARPNSCLEVAAPGVEATWLEDATWPGTASVLGRGVLAGDASRTFVVVATAGTGLHIDLHLVSLRPLPTRVLRIGFTTETRLLDLRCRENALTMFLDTGRVLTVSVSANRWQLDDTSTAVREAHTEGSLVFGPCGLRFNMVGVTLELLDAQGHPRCIKTPRVNPAFVVESGRPTPLLWVPVGGSQYEVWASVHAGLWQALRVHLPGPIESAHVRRDTVLVQGRTAEGLWVEGLRMRASELSRLQGARYPYGRHLFSDPSRRGVWSLQQPQGRGPLVAEPLKPLDEVRFIQRGRDHNKPTSGP
jgi:tetratricopeptide (TPR) repeat protein